MSAIIALTNIIPVALADFSMSDVLNGASALLTWVLGAISSILTFITSNPIILVMFFVMLISFAIGILFRIWRSVG